MSETNEIILTGVGKNGDESVAVPVDCSVRIISSRKNPTLKGVARVKFAGITINDILIYENKSELSVVYPTRMVNRNGKKTESSIVFPNNGYTSNTLKHIIINRYSEVMLNVGHPYLRKMDKEIQKQTEDNAETE